MLQRKQQDSGGQGWTILWRRLRPRSREWHGVAAPNEPARRMTAALMETVRSFTALRGTPRFEDEPSSFEAALRATMKQS